MPHIDFIQSLHSNTSRNYVQRVVEHDKAECASIASKFGAEYWDGARQFGYGGYFYDGRWLPIAEHMANHYGLKAGDKILDVGCGKGYLLYELTRVVPGIEVAGVDISKYGIANSKEEIRPFLQVGRAQQLPYADNEFDFVFSLATLHNLGLADVTRAVMEIERVGKKTSRKYIMVESYRNEREKMNLLYWQLTCLSFHSAEDWKWLYDQAGYQGDYGFIYFE